MLQGMMMRTAHSYMFCFTCWVIISSFSPSDIKGILFPLPCTHPVMQQVLLQYKSPEIPMVDPFWSTLPMGWCGRTDVGVSWRPVWFGGTSFCQLSREKLHICSKMGCWVWGVTVGPPMCSHTLLRFCQPASQINISPFWCYVLYLVL